MPRVLNKRYGGVPAGAVYVGRPTKWGNPFVASKYHDRAEVVERYRVHARDVIGHDQIRAELRGKDLVCWCAPLKCHADVLLEIANAPD